VIGLVLAGGKSSRLGQDKTALEIQGQTLLQRTATLLLRHCDQVFISTRSTDMADCGFEIILDATERIGPLGGITTALSRISGPLLVLACDLPFMDSATLQKLINFHASKPASAVLTTFQQVQTGFIESLVAIYEPDSLALLNQGIANKLYKLSRIIPEHQRHLLPYDQELEHVFFNVNYPHDLERMRQQQALQT